MTKPNGVILYQGPSVLDGAPIVVVAVLKSANAKTGNMIQTFIIRSDIHPVEAIKQSADVSICGTCPHRHATGGACYVNVGQSVAAVYKAFVAGKYPEFDPAIHGGLFEGRKIRLGSYGDPAAVPATVWTPVVDLCDSNTGYTHQIRHKNFDPAILDLCMVSADSPKQAAKYQAMGARTFRVAMPDDIAGPQEIECLSDTKGMTCLECGLCNGASKQAPSVFIRVHGARKGNFKSNLIASVPA